MNLSKLYESLSPAERRELASKAGVDHQYLWQIATGWRGRRGSVDVIRRLIDADKRLDALEVMSEFSDRRPTKEPSHA